MSLDIINSPCLFLSLFLPFSYAHHTIQSAQCSIKESISNLLYLCCDIKSIQQQTFTRAFPIQLCFKNLSICKYDDE